MIQRLALAQSLLVSPDILILDEPCAGLDAVGRKHMIELIKNLKKDGKTIILNSHILADVEEVADMIIKKHGGTLKVQSDINKGCKFILQFKKF